MPAGAFLHPRNSTLKYLCVYLYLVDFAEGPLEGDKFRDNDGDAATTTAEEFLAKASLASKPNALRDEIPRSGNPLTSIL